MLPLNLPDSRNSLQVMSRQQRRTGGGRGVRQGGGGGCVCTSAGMWVGVPLVWSLSRRCVMTWGLFSRVISCSRGPRISTNTSRRRVRQISRVCASTLAILHAPHSLWRFTSSMCCLPACLSGGLEECILAIISYKSCRASRPTERQVSDVKQWLDWPCRRVSLQQDQQPCSCF